LRRTVTELLLGEEEGRKGETARPIFPV